MFVLYSFIPGSPQRRDVPSWQANAVAHSFLVVGGTDDVADDVSFEGPTYFVPGRLAWVLA